MGFDTSDDAAVYRISEDMAIVSTADFITPPVDDPYWFGRIAAANSLSDVYAMGGRPLTVLNLVMFPAGKLDMGILKGILKGAYEKVCEAGATIGGGHSVDDNEPKYGLSVQGIVHPDKVLTNRGAKHEDALILTKPVGTGVLFNACRSKKLKFEQLEPVLSQIAELNKKAMEVALNYQINACTDITGFGLAGHALEMAKASGVKLEISYDSIPLYNNALRMYQKGETTGSNRQNRQLTEKFIHFETSITAPEEELLYDPQTSGGLLLSLPASQADDMIKELKDAGVEQSSIIGVVEQTENPGIVIK